MLSLFRKNTFINSLLLLSYIVILRLYSFIQPNTYIAGPDDNSFVKILYLHILSNDLIQSIAGVLVCFFISILVNRMTINHRLLKDITFYQGVFVSLLCMLFSVNSCSPELLALWIFLVALSKIFKWYNNDNPTAFIFLGGFYIGVSSILFFPYFYFIAFGIIALFVMRSFNIKEILQYILGFVCPFYLTFGFQLWFGTDHPITFEYIANKLTFFMPNVTLGWFDIGLLLVLLVLLLLTAFSFTQLSKGNIILVQKKINLLYWVLFFSPAFIFYGEKISSEQAFVVLPVISLVITYYLLNQKNKIIPEFVHAVFLILVIVKQYF